MHWKRCPSSGHLFLLFLYRPHNPATPLPGSVRYPDGPVLQYPVLQNPVTPITHYASGTSHNSRFLTCMLLIFSLIIDKK